MIHAEIQSRWNEMSGMKRISKPATSSAPAFSSSAITHLKLFQLFGSTPLSLEPPNFSEISKTALFFTMIFGVLNTAHILDPNLQWRKNGQFTKYVSMAANLVFISSPILVTCVALQKRFLLERTLNNLMMIQRQLGLRQSRMFRSIVIMIVFFFLSMVGFLIFRLVIFFTMEPLLRWIWDDTMWIAYYTFMFFNLIKIAYLLKSVGACFSRLSITQSSKTCSRESTNDFLKTYSRLVDMIADLNEVFDSTITIYFFSTFFFTLDMMTEIFVKTEQNFVDKLMFYAWIPVPILGAYYLFDTCHKLTNQAEECNSAMVNSIIFHKSESVQSNPLVMVHLSGKNRVIIKSCDTFIVDYSFGISMLAAFFTYIVVLYQMEKDAKSAPIVTMFSNSSS